MFRTYGNPELKFYDEAATTLRGKRNTKVVAGKKGRKGNRGPVPDAAKIFTNECFALDYKRALALISLPAARVVYG